MVIKFNPNNPKEHAFWLINKEYERATSNYPSFNSGHEGWAIIREEVDELWDEVKKKQGERSPERLKKEAIQIAAMALRFILEVEGNE